ncbi:MAG: METTL5 family protein [Candidatus Woesearchaeota archaeon]
MDKKKLALMLSKLKTFESADNHLEQYPTESEIASDVLWIAFMSGDVKGKSVADFGCGPGIFGIGCLLLGAKKAVFVDVDKKALDIARSNLKLMEGETGRKYNAVFRNKNVKDIKLKVDVVIQNPPFGVQASHSDKIFLIKAMEAAPITYSYHKLATKDFVENTARDYGFRAKLVAKFNFPLRSTMWFHIKNVHFVDVGCWRIFR